MYLSVGHDVRCIVRIWYGRCSCNVLREWFPLTLGLYSQPDVSRWNRLCKRRNSGVGFLGLTLGFRPFEFVLGSIEE
jgi:hypothetical protein